MDCTRAVWLRSWRHSVLFNEIENRCANQFQLLAGRGRTGRGGYPETGAEKEPEPSPYIQAYRTSVTKALKQADEPRKDAVIKAIRDDLQ
jgi:hypothetical protein